MFRKWKKKKLLYLIPLLLPVVALGLFFGLRQRPSALGGSLRCETYADVTAESGASAKAARGRKDTAAAESVTAETAETVESAAQKVSIYLCGAVVHPAVYEVPKGARLHEVLTLAGGFSENAAQDAVNLAAVVEDGSMVRVPTVEEAVRGTAEVLAEESAGSGKVDLNRADKEALMRLPGVGERKAEQILAYRKAHGKFKSTEEIKKIPGIKEKAFEKLKDSITVSE
ncbi:ComEA family DNA-binding protein [Stomatobaculum longum]|uniref:ComEA family DNA-binding protein n=1 Tax=Stomatobaculum longum TaxID=796942 RepID=UPI0028E27C85|nr:ComEA family DNA-binding protein [Stomatobaculum longum]